MISKIHDLVNLLRDVRGEFQARVIDATEKRKTELEALNNCYVKGTEIYRDKEQQIERDYNIALTNARKWAAEKAGEGISDLKEWETQRAERIDEAALAKINAIRDVPLTQMELQIVLEKYGKFDYWVQRSVADLAEKNGIAQTALNLESPVDVKLHVLQQLNDQLEKMLAHFTADNRELKYNTEVRNARWLYLNNDVLDNAIKIYNNGFRDVSELDAMTRAYHQIKATGGQMQKGVLIANVLRNLKSEDAKNELLYRLSADNGISTTAFEVAGIADEMAAWRNGKNERYVRASRMMEKLETERDTEKIIETLRNYMVDVDNGRQQENEFVSKALAKTQKKNSSISEALSELTNVERNALLHDVDQQTKPTNAE